MAKSSGFKKTLRPTSPLETPIVVGEAKSFLITHCSIQPASDSEIPIIPPTNILGSLLLKTINLADESSAIKIAFMTLKKSNDIVPMLSEAIITIIQIINNKLRVIS